MPISALMKTRRRTTLLVAAAVVTIGGAVVFFADLLPDDTSPAPSPTSTTGDTSQSPAKAGTSLTTAPRGIVWKLFDGEALPTSTKHGPRRDDGHTATGYSHTDNGALIAAANIAARAGLSVPQDSWEPTIENQFLPGKDRDALLRTMRAEPPRDFDSGDVADIIGFTYRAYVDATASLELVLTAGSSRYTGLSCTLEWSQGDWRMRAPSGGDWSSLIRPVTSLNGVVTWKP